MQAQLNAKVIAITGACGTVGRAILGQLVTNYHEDVQEILCLDNDESGLFFLDQEFLNESFVKTFYVDIRDSNEIMRKLSGVDLVFHCAAMKHVIVSEKSPEQAIATNINGVTNVIEACRENGVQKLIFTSSDKAVNPTNVMGTTKLMGERLVTAANSVSRSGETIFASTRFGNVLGSSGSVVPIFKNQLLNGMPITITHSEMTRFIMSIEQAAKLVIDASMVVCGGEVLVMKMPVVRISDLGTAIAEELHEMGLIASPDPKVEYIGIKSGEKLYEELMSDEETRRTIELKNYFSVLPAFRSIYANTAYEYDKNQQIGVDNPYHSGKEAPLSVGQIRDYLKNTRVLMDDNINTTTRYWPGDKEE